MQGVCPGGSRIGTPIQELSCCILPWPLMPKAQLLCIPVLNLRDRAFCEIEKESIYHFSRQMGPRQAKCLQNHLGKIVRSFMGIVERVRYQLLDILLMGWW